MRTDFALRLPGWARFVPPEDHWVVLCADAAYNPFELRDEAKAWRVAHADLAELSPEVPWCRAGLDMEKHRILRLDPPLAPPDPDLGGIGNCTRHHPPRIARQPRGQSLSTSRGSGCPGRAGRADTVPIERPAISAIARTLNRGPTCSR